MCFNKRIINYDPETIKPFLTKKRDTPKKLFNGEASYDCAKNADDEYYYHVTNLINFKNIIIEGLKTERGSTGGAGQILANGRFKKNEKGRIFASAFPYVVDNYVYEYDSIADGKGKGKDKDKNFYSLPILLRFKLPESKYTIQIDKKQKDAIFVNKDIPSYELEFLTYEGWYSLRTLEAREVVSKIIDEILI